MKYFAQQCVYKLENANRMNVENDYLEKHRSLKLTTEEIENLKSPNTIRCRCVYLHTQTHTHKSRSGFWSFGSQCLSNFVTLFIKKTHVSETKK